MTQADLDAGFVTNTATAHAAFTLFGDADATAVDSNADSATVLATQLPALTLDKSSPTATYDAVGDTLTYSYLLTNTGNVTLAGPFTVTDDRATVTCPADTSLAPGHSVTCSATYSASQADLDAGFVTNTATAHAAFTRYLESSPSAVDSNADSATIPATQLPKISIDKTTTTTTYDSVGDTLTYSYLVTNTGNVTLSGPFTVSDDRALDESCPALPSLAPGATITCSATDAVTQADLDAGFVTNTATGSGSFTFHLDAAPTTITSSADSVTIIATQLPKLTLDKTTPTVTYDSVGDTLTYSYLLTNTGNVTLAGPFTVSDDRATVTCPADTSLAPGHSVTCSATDTATQADLDAGFVTNTATAHAAFTRYLESSPTAVDSNGDSTTIEATQYVTLDLTKTGSLDVGSDGRATPGDLITFSFTVDNTGNVTLTAPTVTDDHCTPAYASGDLNLNGKLDVEETWTFTCSYGIDQADIDAGSLTNHAAANADGPLGRHADATDDATDTATAPSTCRRS